MSTPEPTIRTMRQLTPPAKMEMVSFLQPWFLDRKGGAGGSLITRDLLAVIDGLGVPPTLGITGDARLDFDCTIVGWTLLADQVGSIEIDIWKDTYANYPPTVLDSIVGAAPPTIVTDDHATDTTLTGWTTAVAAGDCLRYNLDSVTDITRITLALHLEG